MKVLATLLGILLMQFTVAISQINMENKFEWGSRKLNWEDFKALPEVNKPFAAISSSSISISNKFYSDSIEFKVTSVFNPNKSWIKPNCKNGTILSHEQGHFDITEIYARKLRQEIFHKQFYSKTVNSEFKSMHVYISKACSNYQDLYDQETKHANDTLKQKEWEVKILFQLEELESFKDQFLRTKAN